MNYNFRAPEYCIGQKVYKFCDVTEHLYECKVLKIFTEISEKEYDIWYEIERKSQEPEKIKEEELYYTVGEFVWKHKFFGVSENVNYHLTIIGLEKNKEIEEFTYPIASVKVKDFSHAKTICEHMNENYSITSWFCDKNYKKMSNIPGLIKGTYYINFGKNTCSINKQKLSKEISLDTLISLGNFASGNILNKKTEKEFKRGLS